MPLSTTATDSTLVASILPRLHKDLQPLFDDTNPCLPVLQSTCKKILDLTGTTASAEKIAQQIQHDPGLTCKVLQIANSIAYSPQQTIESVPHAVSWLGLNTVRSLVAAAHLASQIQDWPNRHHALEVVIARSLLAATYAAELGASLDYPHPGHLFTGALLHSISDLAIAYQAPELHQSLLAIPATLPPADRTLAETRVIGVPRLVLGHTLASLWRLPDQIVGLFSVGHDLPRGRWHSNPHIYQGLIHGSTRLVDAMASTGSRTTIDDAKRALHIGSGLPMNRFAEVLSQATDRGHQLTRSMGLSMELPQLDKRPSGQETIPALTASANGAAQGTQAPPAHSDPLRSLQAFQTSLQGVKDLNSLLGALAQALHTDVGFARIGLALLNPHDSDQLIGRLVLGVAPPAPYLQALSGSLSQDHICFLGILKRYDPLLVDDVSRYSGSPIAPAFLATWKPCSALLAPLRVGTKPIGLIYCDHGPQRVSITPQDYQAFSLYFTQATLGINRLAGLM